MDHEEVEWQFDAVHLGPVERWLHANVGEQGRRLIGRAGTSLVDTYLDTEDWRLFRAGCSLRIRKRPPGTEATLKSFSQAGDALRRRREITEPLAFAELESAREIPGSLGDRVRAVTGPKSLRVLFEVRTRRRIYRVDFDGSHAAEIALDETTIPVDGGDPPARLRRVEVEVEIQPDEAIPSIEEFVESMREACGLRPAALTKFEAGLASRSLHPQTAIDIGSTRIDDSCSVGEVAFAVL